MGSTVSTFMGRTDNIEFMETGTKGPSKDQDNRRRNSLMFFMQDWQKMTTYEQQEGAMMQVKKYHKMEAKETGMGDPVQAKLNKVLEEITLGDMRRLRDAVIMKWKDINRSYQGPMLGDTVLHRVCREGYLPALKFMMDPNSKSIFEKMKLDGTIKNKRKRTPLMLCFTPPHFTGVAKEFGLRRDEETGLAIPNNQAPATAKGKDDALLPGGQEEREAIVRVLVEELSVDVNELDMHDYSPLHYAAICGWEGTVQFLLERKANIRHTCLTGETALHFAVAFRHGAAAEVLLEACPELVNEADKEGDRAVHLAVQNGEQEFVKLLMDFEADLNTPNYKGGSPLKVACQQQDWQMVNLLLDNKVTREEEAFALLEGDADERIRWRLKREEEERLKLATAAEAIEADEERKKAAEAYGMWVPYTDKMGRGIFYYNKVSRESRWDAPADYTKDKEYIMKTATFGMHFYH